MPLGRRFQRFQWCIQHNRRRNQNKQAEKLKLNFKTLDMCVYIMSVLIMRGVAVRHTVGRAMFESRF